METVIQVNNVKKSFKVFFDKGASLKERLLFRHRNHYENRTVLNGISFEVEKGSAIGIIGENGSGKSTLLKLMTRIIYPDEGTITIKGRVSALIELGAGFHPDMSGRENIYNNAAIFGLTKKEINTRLQDIIDFSELEEFIDNPVRTYSSGMYMRLAFAVAINVDADVLLIDEILAVGDASFQAKCFNKLRELKASGVTIVLVTHDTGTVEKFCDHTIWINDGLVQAQGKSKLATDAYLSYMNEKLYNSIRQQEEINYMDEMLQQQPQQLFESDKDNENEQAEETIDFTTNRFGLRYIEIVRGGLIGRNNKYTKLLKYGESAKIRIEYKVNTPIPQYNFGMGIFTMEYNCIFATNSTIDGILISENDLKDKTGKIDFCIDNIPLLAGTYILQLAIVDNNNTPMDYYRDYIHFEIITIEKGSGIVGIPHYWELNNKILTAENDMKN